MKTTTIVIGDDSQAENKTPIQLIQFITRDKKFENVNPNDFNHYYLELICRNYDDDLYDLIFGYDDPKQRQNGTLFFGYWNDGVV